MARFCFLGRLSKTVVITGSLALASATALTSCHAPLTPGMSLASLPFSVTDITPELVKEMKLEAKNKKRSKAKNIQENAGDEATKYEYRVGAGDRLFMKLWEHQNPIVSNQIPTTNEQAGTVVSSNGTIFFPFAGEVYVEGKTVDEIRTILTENLAQYYVLPQLEVNILQFRSQKISVTGEVKKPGSQYVTQEPSTVLNAINDAEGSLDTADLKDAYIIRKDGAKEKLDLLALYHDGDSSQNKVLHAGDTLHLPANHRNKIFLMGELIEPRIQLIRGGRLTLAEAVNEAGGLNMLTADARHIYVIRNVVTDEMIDDAEKKKKTGLAPHRDRRTKKVAGDDRFAKIYEMNLASADQMVVADQFMLEPRDVVFVSTSAVTQWNRVLGQLIPSNVINAVDSKRLDSNF